METKLIAKNPNAHHNYNIKSTIEVGIELTGTEIKSIRNGKINLKRCLCCNQKWWSFCLWNSY